MSVTAGVSDAAIAVREKLRGGIGQTRLRRYWPGKAPEWAEEVEEDENVRMQKVSKWTSNDPLREKYNKKMAGMDAPIAKPKGSKKMKDWET